MLLQCCSLLGISWEILHHYIIGIDIDCFVADYKLFKVTMRVNATGDGNWGVGYLQEVFPHRDEMVYCRVTSLVLYQEKANVAIFLVCQNVEELILVVIDDLSDAQDIEKLINVDIVILF